MSLVKEDENYDLQNNEADQFKLHENFNICILMNMTDEFTDDEIVQMLLD